MKVRKTYIWGLLFLLSALLPLQVSAKSPFTDVPDRYWAKDAIQWAYDEGLTSGYPNGTFKPDQAITESQLVAMLVRFDRSSPNSFPAKKGEHKSMGNYRYLGKHHLPLHGINSRFARDSAVERAHAAKIFAAFHGKDLYVQEAVYYLYTHDLAAGITGKNDYADFRPKADLTRAETADILYQMAVKQGRTILGLSAKATGKDNAQYTKPPKFADDGEIEFQRPNQPPLSGTEAEKPADNVAVDIEKPVLTANGKDETFITFTFRDCSGKLIPYDQELEFTAVSKEGARIVTADRTGEPQDFGKPNIPPESKPEPERPSAPEPPAQNEDPDREFAEAGQAEALSAAAKVAAISGAEKQHVISDGPEVTVKVVAPRMMNERVDTITVTPVSKAGACPLPSATAHITYVPRAEIQLDLYENTSTGFTTLTATMARPGGATITEFNGYLNLETLYSLPFSSYSPRFINGTATVSFLTPTVWMKNEITATAIAESPVTDDAVRSIADKSFSIPVSYAPPITADNTCTNERPEIGFLIDSSGSMLRNDHDRLRVTKTQEFIETLQADVNIAAHFTTSGMFLKKDTPVPTAESVNKVIQRGGTNIASGLKVAISKFTPDQPQTLILLTDGKSDKASILGEVDNAVRRGIKIYTIGLGKSLDTGLLKEIAARTGGEYFFIKENIELTSVYQSILQEINCGIPIPACPLSGAIFESPSVVRSDQDVRMSTELMPGCGPVSKVIVRFSSTDGHLDYELTHRGQGIYQLNKKSYELEDFLLRGNAVFIAYDKAGNKIGEQIVPIRN
ncbi:S-layer homology domain-containing protein [Sporosarcina sp. P33]|uniref:S-layer homology domain-containing protein n=1 Tax=Sporosarcina sp. P33 TaxID=1930764 RepID=UPI0009BDADE0|nr:S-layer homology domain-containing protein [Sporosarcina sp. P33]ARD48961.1 hypothetical protein SporoP33_12455 [Sporosarcina sp. P33]